MGEITIPPTISEIGLQKGLFQKTKGNTQINHPSPMPVLEVIGKRLQKYHPLPEDFQKRFAFKKRQKMPCKNGIFKLIALYGLMQIRQFFQSKFQIKKQRWKFWKQF